MNEQQFNSVINVICDKFTKCLYDQNQNLISVISSNTKIIQQGFKLMETQIYKQTNYLKLIAKNTQNLCQQITSVKKNPMILKNINNLEESSQKQQGKEKKQPIQHLQISTTENSKSIINRQNRLLSQIKETLYAQSPKNFNLVNGFIKPQFKQENKILIHSQNENKKILNKIQNIPKYILKNKPAQIEIGDNKIKKLKKQIFIHIPLQKIVFNQKNEPILEKWAIELYQTINQQAYDRFSNQLMSESETKSFYSKNVLHNFINLMKFVKQRNQDFQINKLFQMFHCTTKKILKYEKLKYPEASKIFTSEIINKLIQPCFKHLDSENSIVKNAGVKFIYNKNRNYNMQIKQLLNILMKKIAEEYQQFKTMLQFIFVKKADEKSLSKSKSKMQDDNIQVEYLQHKIGTKININVPLFQQKSDKFIIPNSQILRVIIKWIEHLNQKINNPEVYILDRIHFFAGKNELEINFDNATKKQIYQRFKQFVRNNSRQSQKYMTGLQNSILDYITNNIPYLPYIPQEEVQVGLAAHLLSQQITKLAVNQLNQLIHTILQFQQLYKYENNISKSQQKEDKIKTFYDVSYVTFHVFDLMRAQCTGNIQQIKLVYVKLRSIQQLTIVRVKNRLSTGNRDFLINFKYKDILICELQLRLKLDKEEKKQSYMTKFNHFLYQFQRTIYGTLRESSYIIIQQLENYDKIKQLLKAERKQFLMNQSHNGMIEKIKLSTFTQKNLEQVNEFYVCRNCYQISYESKFKQDRLQICCRCVVQNLDSRKRCELIFGKKFNVKEVNKIEKDAYYILVKKNNIKIKKWVIGENQYYIDIAQNMNSIINQDQNVAIQKLKSDHQFFIFQNVIAAQIYENLKIQCKGFTQVLEKSISRIEIFRQKDSNRLIQKCISKQKVKQMIENQIHEIDFQNLKFEPIQFESYLKKFEKIINLDLSHNCLHNIDFLNTINREKKNLLRLQKLNISHNPIANIKILDNLSNIKRLEMSNMQLTELNLSSLTQLQQLDLDGNNLSDINITNLVNLKHLNISNNRLAQLDITYNQMLYNLKAKNNTEKFLKINIKDYQRYNSTCDKILYKGTYINEQFIEYIQQMNIKQLLFHEAKIQKSKFVIANWNKLKKLQIIKCQVNELMITNNQTIQSMIIVNNNYEMLVKLSVGSEKLLDLKKLVLNGVKMQQLKISIFPNLQQLELKSVQSTQSLLIPQSSHLKKLTLWQIKMKQLKIQKYPQLQQIQLKNVNLQDNTVIISASSKLNKLSLFDMVFTKLILQSRQLYQIKLNKLEILNDVLILGQLPNLKKMSLSNLNLDSLNLHKYSQIQQLDINEVKILSQTLLIPSLTLRKLYLRSLVLKSLKIKQSQQFQQIHLYDIRLSDQLLIIPKMSNLKKLSLKSVIMKQLNMNHFSSLQAIQFTQVVIINNIFILPQLKHLESISLNHMKLHQFAIRNQLSLQYISLEKLQIQTKLILQGLIKLKKFHLHGNKFKQISLKLNLILEDFSSKNNGNCKLDQIEQEEIYRLDFKLEETFAIEGKWQNKTTY